MKAQHESEPSMDEILASIRQIISGEHQEPREESPEDSFEDILELMNPLPEKEELKIPHPDDLSSLLPKESKDLRAPRYQEEHSYVSASAQSETMKAFQELNKVSHTTPSKQSPTPNNKTIEDIMRELLKPLLKDWLDANLPTIVRWVVQEQVERIVQETAQRNKNSF